CTPRLLVLALAAALSSPAWSQTAAPDSGTETPVPGSQSSALPFRVADIRVDGLQRISAGTVFTYLPVERGDVFDADAASEAIRRLCARADWTGQSMYVSGYVSRPSDA